MTQAWLIIITYLFIFAIARAENEYAFEIIENPEVFACKNLVKTEKLFHKHTVSTVLKNLTIC